MNQETDTYLLEGNWLTGDEVLAHFKQGGMLPGRIPMRDRYVINYLMAQQREIELLDVGCYVGHFSEALHQLMPHVSVRAVDYFEDNIRIAKLIYPHLADSLLTQSVYALDFPAERFDFVALKEVIEHIDRPVDAIREANRVLKTGGLLFVSTPNGMAHPWLSAAYSIRRWLYKVLRKSGRLKPVVYHEGLEWSRHIYAWTPKTLYTLLYLNGFELVDYGFFPDGVISRVFPEFSNGLYFLVKKASDAPRKII